MTSPIDESALTATPARAHPRSRQIRNWLARVVGLMFVYWGAAVLSDFFGATDERIYLIWLPIGVSIAALLNYGLSIWPGALLGSIINSVSSNHWPALAIIGVAAGTTAAVVAAAWVHRRLNRGVPVLLRVRDVVSFVFIGGLACTMISAHLGVLSLYLTGVMAAENYANGVVVWWLADSLGFILAGAMFTTWLHSRPSALAGIRDLVHATALGGSIILVGLLSTSGSLDPESAEPIVFLAFPLAMWAALKYGQHGATVATFVLSILLLNAARHDIGPFEGADHSQGHAILAAFLISLAMTSMTVAAASRERRTANRDRAESEQRYRDLADATFVGILIHDGSRVLEANTAMGAMLGWPPDELIGRSPLEFFVMRSDTGENALLAPTETMPIETFAHHRDGRLVNVEIVGKTTAFRGKTARVILVRDLSERSEAEREIARLNSFYAQVLNETPAEIAVWDLEGRYLFVSASSVRDPELREWLIGKTNFDYCRHRGRNLAVAQRRQEAFDKAVATRQTVRFEEVLDSPIGKQYFVRYSSPVLDLKGRVTHVLGYGIDISELKRMQAELERIHTSLRCLLWHGPVYVEDGLYTWQVKLTDLDAAQRFLPLEVPPGSTYLERLAQARESFPEDINDTHRAFTQALDRGDTHYQGEYRVKLDDGSVRWLCEDVYLERVSERELQVFGVTTDVTAYKRTEETLRMTVSMYRNVVETSHDVIWSIDAAGNLTFINRAAGKVFGLSDVQMLGRRVSEFVPEDARGLVTELVAGLLKGDGLRFQTVPFNRPDGSVGFLSINAVPLREDDGISSGAAGTAADITEIRLAEIERERLDAQIRHAQKLESLGVLAGGVAHDFNNLLVSILGHAGLALLDMPENSPLRSSVQQIEAAALRAAELTNQLLAYAGKGQFVITAISLTQLVRDMLHLLEISISKRAVLKHEFCDDLPLIEGDATQIRQIVMNLILNASDALEDRHGVISVSTGIAHVSEKDLSRAVIQEDMHEGEYVFVDVRDTGIGMTPETISRVFEPFFTTKFTGRGLGLAAVLGIVRAHRGTMLIESQPGKGSTFRVLLPASPAAPNRPEPAPDIADAVSGGATVLVVDDEESVRSVLAEILRHFGYRVLTAADGYEAIDVFKVHASSIAAVVLDMLMPVMDGVETLAHLREIRNGVPVILTSGYSEQEATRHVTFDSRIAFMQKPYQPAALADKIQSVLRG